MYNTQKPTVLIQNIQQLTAVIHFPIKTPIRYEKFPSKIITTSYSFHQMIIQYNTQCELGSPGPTLDSKDVNLIASNFDKGLYWQSLIRKQKQVNRQ